MTGPTVQTPLPTFLGHMSENWPVFETKLIAWLRLNGVVEDDPRRDCLLLALGGAASIWFERQDSSKRTTFNSCLTLLRAKYGTKLRIMMERRSSGNKLGLRAFRDEHHENEMVEDLVNDVDELLVKSGVEADDVKREIFRKCFHGYPVALKMIERADNYEKAVYAALSWESGLIEQVFNKHETTSLFLSHSLQDNNILSKSKDRDSIPGPSSQDSANGLQPPVRSFQGAGRTPSVPDKLHSFLSMAPTEHDSSSFPSTPANSAPNSVISPPLPVPTVVANLPVSQPSSSTDSSFAHHRENARRSASSGATSSSGRAARYSHPFSQGANRLSESFLPSTTPSSPSYEQSLHQMHQGSRSSPPEARADLPDPTYDPPSSTNGSPEQWFVTPAPPPAQSPPTRETPRPKLPPVMTMQLSMGQDGSSQAVQLQSPAQDDDDEEMWQNKSDSAGTAHPLSAGSQSTPMASYLFPNTAAFDSFPGSRNSQHTEESGDHPHLYTLHPDPPTSVMASDNDHHPYDSSLKRQQDHMEIMSDGFDESSSPTSRGKPRKLLRKGSLQQRQVILQDSGGRHSPALVAGSLIGLRRSRASFHSTSASLSGSGGGSRMSRLFGRIKDSSPE